MFSPNLRTPLAQRKRRRSYSSGVTGGIRDQQGISIFDERFSRTVLAAFQVQGTIAATTAGRAAADEEEEIEVRQLFNKSSS